MSFIKVENLYKSYGDNLVLERLDLTVEKGEFVSMVGASGCGKSTFLNMLLGKESPSKGRILLEGKPLIQEPDQERGIVFQKYSVFPHLTVLQNVMIADEFSQAKFLGWTFGKTKADIKNKAKDGSYYWVQTAIIPIFDEENNIVEYISIKTDVTEQKNQINKLNLK